MKEGWEYKSLGDVCEILDSRRKPITKNKRESGTIPYYGATGILDYVKDYIFDEKLVLLGEDGAKWGAGENSAYIVEGKTWVNNHAHALRPKRELLIDELLVYYLNFANLQPFITGVTVPKLNQEKMRSIEIPVPSLPEQQSIVDYLDSAFVKIDAMKANAEKNLNEAKALFQASLKEMLEPKEGWEEKKLQDICSDIVDCPHTTPQKVGFPTQYPCIRTSELKGGSIDWSSMQYLDEDEYRKRVSRLVPKANDIVYGREGTYGDAVLLPDGYSFSLGQRTMLLRPNEIYVIPRFLLYSMISSHVYQQAKAKNSGCGVGHVNVKDIKVFKIGIPTIDIQQSIVATLDSLKSKVDRLQENYNKISQECDALKQAILRQVFE